MRHRSGSGGPGHFERAGRGFSQAPVEGAARSSGEEALRGGADDLRKERLRLFLDPAGAPCPPWQSACAEEPQLNHPQPFPRLDRKEGSSNKGEPGGLEAGAAGGAHTSIIGD